MWSNTSRSGIRRRWQPNGWVGATTARSGNRAANWSQTGSTRHDGSVGTVPPTIIECEHLYDRGGRACLLLAPIAGRSKYDPLSLSDPRSGWGGGRGGVNQGGGSKWHRSSRI